MSAQETFNKLAEFLKVMSEIRDQAEHCRSMFCSDSLRAHGAVLDLSFMPPEALTSAVKDEICRMVGSANEMEKQIGGLGYEINSRVVEMRELRDQLLADFNGVLGELKKSHGRVSELEARLQEHALHKPEVREAVWAMTDGKCWHCDCHLIRNGEAEQASDKSRVFHVDHLVAKTNGGPDHMSNYVPSCQRCNISKGDKHYVEFTRKRQAQLSVIEGGMAKDGTNP